MLVAGKVCWSGSKEQASKRVGHAGPRNSSYVSMSPAVTGIVCCMHDVKRGQLTCMTSSSAWLCCTAPCWSTHRTLPITSLMLMLKPWPVPWPVHNLGYHTLMRVSSEIRYMPSSWLAPFCRTSRGMLERGTYVTNGTSCMAYPLDASVHVHMACVFITVCFPIHA